MVVVKRKRVWECVGCGSIRREIVISSIEQGTKCDVCGRKCWRIKDSPLK